MNTKFYAIFHKPTQKYMPARMFENARAGWTWWEPTGANGYGGFDPEVLRLFTKKSSAVQAMGYWLNGQYEFKATGHYEDLDYKLKRISPQIPRNPRDIEIHEVKIVITAISN